jgi:hypothetical protein
MVPLERVRRENDGRLAGSLFIVSGAPRTVNFMAKNGSAHPI